MFGQGDQDDDAGSVPSGEAAMLQRRIISLHSALQYVRKENAHLRSSLTMAFIGAFKRQPAKDLYLLGKRSKPMLHPI